METRKKENEILLQKNKMDEISHKKKQQSSPRVTFFNSGDLMYVAVFSLIPRVLRVYSKYQRMVYVLIFEVWVTLFFFSELHSKSPKASMLKMENFHLLILLEKILCLELMIQIIIHYQ